MSSLPAHVTVTSAELVRQFGRWQDEAAVRPVVVTHHGRGRAVLISYGQFEDFSSKDASPGPAEGRPSGVQGVGDLMEHVDQGFIAFGADLKVRAINQAACCYLKLDRETVIGHTLGERIPGAEESIGYASLSRAIEGGSIETFEMPSFAYNQRWLMFRAFPFDGGAACVFRDITDEMEARSQIDAKIATLAAMEAHAGVGRAILSVRGTFTRIDTAFASFAGFSADGLLRARLNDIIVPRQRTHTVDVLEAVMNDGAPVMLEVDLLTKEGRERPVRVGLAALRGCDGPTGAVAVVTDRPA